jgi:hypothetical protein
MSVAGTWWMSNVRHWHKADVPEPPINIYFWGNSGHQNETAEL